MILYETIYIKDYVLPNTERQPRFFAFILLSAMLLDMG